MTIDIQHKTLPQDSKGVVHRYGKNVFLHSFPYPITLLTKLSSPNTVQPMFNNIVRELYSFLLSRISSLELSQTLIEQPTRMYSQHKEAIIKSSVLDESQKIVIVDVVRAGILPSQVFFDGLSLLLDPANIRQDHVFMNRKVNAKGEVIGVDTSGSKIGGHVNGRTVIIPDPMGATGGSMVETVELYRKRPEGAPAKFVVAHLIITPEYIKRITTECPDVHIHAIRLDRGFSPDSVLETIPGEQWDKEAGLNQFQYIVPGAGGVGELMNNAEF